MSVSGFPQYLVQGVPAQRFALMDYVRVDLADKHLGLNRNIQKTKESPQGKLSGI